jgi:NADH-quinone oxidoreductase subunit M
MTSLLHHVLSLILLTPIAGALVILLVGSRRPSAVRGIANACAAAAFAASVPLWFLYEPHGKTWQFAERGDLIPAIGASLYVGVDGFSVLLILLTTLLAWMVAVAAASDIKTRVKEFYACMLVLEASLLGSFMALDFLLFFLSWVVMLATMYVLIRRWGEGRPRESSVRFIIFTSIGSAAVLGGILALVFHNYSVTGTYSFDITHFHTIHVPPGMQRWVFAAFFLGFAASVPMFPLHAWFAGAQTNAPIAPSVMLAAVMLKIGAYGFVRFSLPILPDASRFFVPLIAALAVAGAIYGALLAFAQRDWKRLVAYWSMSQMSLVMLGLCALTPVGITGSLIQQMNHGISAGALLLIAGAIVTRETREIPAEERSLRTRPILATILLVMTLSAIGLPALGGFVGQKLIIQGVYAVNRWWAAGAGVAVALGAVYLLRLYWRTVFGRAPISAAAGFRALTGREIAALIPLAALAVAIGLYPAPVLSRLETTVGRVVARVNPAYAPFVAQGSDCATPAPPDPAGPPPVFVLVEPCADGSGAATPEAKPSQPPGKSQ